MEEYLRGLGLDKAHEDVLRVGELVLVQSVMLYGGSNPSRN